MGETRDVARTVLTELGPVWAVVGLSTNRARAAYGVAEVLRQHGKRVIPVHPRAEAVAGETGYATLAEVPEQIDVVDVFVGSARAGAIADAAIEAGARAVWFQLGVHDDAAAARVRAAGLAMVEDTCPAIELRSMP